MKCTLRLLWLLVALCITACKAPPPEMSRFKTDYVPNGVYVLQRSVFLCDNGFLWHPSVDNPRYYFYTHKRDRDVEIPTGIRVRFVKVIYHFNWENGASYWPTGIILNGPWAGTPVGMEFISKYGIDSGNKWAEDPRLVDPDYLRLEQ